MFRKLFIAIPFLIMLVTMIGSNDVAHADTGDFYDRHEEEFENAVMHPDYVDLVKDYDYETNSFDCGWFGFFCKVKGQMFSLTLGIVKASYSSGDSAIVKPYDIIQNSVFSKYKRALETLSIWMLAIFLMWNLMKTVAMRFAESEDGMVAINEKLVKVVTLSILLGVYNPLFEMIMKLQQYATESVLGNAIDQEDVAVTLFIKGAEYGFLIALLVAGIMLIFQLAFMYRFVLFGLLYITGVIAIPTGMNDEYNYFSLWLKLLITNGVTLFLQALVFTLGVNAFFVHNAFNNGTSFIVGMAFFILALTIPSLLGQLGASSGTGKALGSVVRVASRRVR